jgi:hypothetical protein
MMDRRTGFRYLLRPTAALLAVGGMVYWLWRVEPAMRRPELGQWALYGGIAAGGLVLMYVARIMRVAGRQHQRLSLAGGACGACEYPLRAIEAGADGLTTCPECGAGWKLGSGTPP